VIASPELRSPITTLPIAARVSSVARRGIGFSLQLPPASSNMRISGRLVTSVVAVTKPTFDGGIVGSGGDARCFGVGRTTGSCGTLASTRGVAASSTIVIA
jgi:hypothetical protein